jgi:drug/metabolite transporter (DMT)-like permease
LSAPTSVTVPTSESGRADPPVGGGLLLAALGVLAFSFSLPMTKIAVRGLDPFVAAIGRAAVAAVPAAFVLWRRGAARPSAGQVRRLAAVVLGVVVGFPLLTAYALHHTASAHGAVVTGLLPLATAGFAVARAGERPSVAYWLCSLLGLGAVVAYSVHSGGGSLHGADALLLGAVLAAGLGYTEGAMLARTMGGPSVICWALVLSAPITWVTTVAMAAGAGGVHASAGQWAAFGYTALFSMFLGFFAWYAGLARAGIARAGQLQLAQPALSVLWGWPLLGERLTVAAVATAAIVFAAVAIGRRAAVR